VLILIITFNTKIRPKKLQPAIQSYQYSQIDQSAITNPNFRSGKVENV